MYLKYKKISVKRRVNIFPQIVQFLKDSFPTLKGIDFLFQEEIRFCINPELLVALMTMEAMQDNEGIVIRVSLKSIYSQP